MSAHLRNDGYITNLPDACCVELPTYVDRLDLHPTTATELLLDMNLAPNEAPAAERTGDAPTPISPPSDPAQRLFQEPHRKAKS